ncbi:MAG: Gfo/Idh/MocA family oxidoreductase [Candidatus Latescibacteria bacterium]|nr:Gfo/Idh/MocA family oxidoreductase [Candidatus Latescibacterota bacterium]
MAHFRCALIGCGGMSSLHAAGYATHKSCEIVAVADISEDKAKARAASHAPGAAIYTDYARMLKAEKPDIVSVCLWPHLHAPAVLASARAGAKAIHCEKPMAPTWGEALKMGACDNMIDWGTHWLDMMFFMNNETPAVWVLGQISATQWREAFGLPIETQAICEFKFQNGVRAVLYTGEDNDIGCSIRLIGSAGRIDLRGGEKPLWVQDKGGKWRTPKVAGNLHGGEAVGWGVHDVVDSLAAGREPELSARRALQATEIIFATYDMIENGDLKIKRK